MRARTKRMGFTLIELLVVIAILAILAAILMPVLTAAKERGRQSQCVNNLMQLGRAIRFYADDWGGKLPTVRITGGESTPGSYSNWCGCHSIGGECWPQKGQIWPYTRNLAIYQCPSDRNAPASERPKVKGTPLQPKSKYPLSYAMNYKLSWRNIDTMQRSRPDKPYPDGMGFNNQLSKIMLLIHESRQTIDDGSYNTVTNSPSNTHFDGTTILYCDLHAKWMKSIAIQRAQEAKEFDPDIPPLRIPR